MASAELIVAKTALSGALFRPDPRPCSRDDIESMLALVNSTITECSPPNVQRCKQWALSNLVPSSARIPPFCKYLVALSKSFGEEKEDAALGSKKGRVPSAKRRRLHVLYLLNDILYHVKYRNRDDAFAQKLEATLPVLVRSAASFINCPKHIRKIQDLIGLWDENQYFSRNFVQQLRTAVEEAPSSREEIRNDGETDNSASAMAKAAKTAPWVMPAMHGDPTVPWYDLPAGNWLPVLEPNSTRPMNPSMIKPLVLAQGPADKTLVEAVRQLLVDVDKLYSKEVDLDHPPANIGRLGERVEIDEITGEVIGGETYYGWSRPFCEKMKRRGRDRTGDGEERRGRTRSSRSYSRSESRSRSWRRARSGTSSRSPPRPAFKRQRLSTSPDDRKRDRDRSRNRSRGPSEQSSHGSPRRRSRSYRRLRSRTRSRSRSRAGGRGRRQRSPSYDPHEKYRPRSPNFSRSPSRSRSRSRSRSPPHRPAGLPHPPRNGFALPNPLPVNWNKHHPPPPPPLQQFPPLALQHPPPGFPVPPLPPQVGGFPVPPPPPPPPNYQGSWAVPPPMPPAAGQPPSFFPGGNPVPPPFVGGWPPPPPPPPPPSSEHQSGFYQQRRGAGGYRGGGGSGGGYGRGGRW